MGRYQKLTNPASNDLLYIIDIDGGINGRPVTKVIEKQNLVSNQTNNNGSGESAYQIAVRLGFQGTEQQWLDSLKGSKGNDGIFVLPTTIKTVSENGDLLILFDSSGNSYGINKSNFLAGISSSPSSSPTPATDNPILSNPNLIAYWDSENVLSSEGLITQFTDRSSNSRNATQGANNLRCSLINGVINGKPIARFTGSQYYNHDATNDPLTIIAAVRNTASASHRTLLGANNSSNNPFGSYYFKTNDPSGKMAFVRSGLSRDAVDNPALSFDRFYVQSARNQGSSLDLFINNLMINSVSTSGTGLTISNPLIGAGYYGGGIVDYFLGDFHTIVLFNAVLSDTLLIQYINYLRDYLKI